MIEGVVDDSKTAFSISGWAIDRDGRYPLDIEARHYGVVIAMGQTSLGRPDLGGAFGYSLVFGTPVDSLLIADDSLVIVAVARDGNAQALGWNSAVLDTIDARRIGRWLSHAPVASVARILDLAATIPAVDPQTHTILTGIRGHIPIVVAAPAPEATPVTPLAPITTAAGVISIDGRAITGKDGHLFPNYGGRDAAAPFPAFEAESLAARLNHLGDRAVEFQRHGFAFLLTVLPEKVSALPECWPTVIDGPSPLLRQMARETASRTLPYLSLLDSVSDHPNWSDCYRKLGTRLTAIGAQAIFSVLCRAIGFEPPFLKAEDRKAEIHPSDFHDSFPTLPLVERMTFLDGADLRAASVGLTARRTDAGHCVWRNPSAPIDAHLVTFGDLGNGARSDTLAWWFARAFRRFDDLAQPEADMEAVLASNPSHIVVVANEREFSRLH